MRVLLSAVIPLVQMLSLTIPNITVDEYRRSDVNRTDPIASERSHIVYMPPSMDEPQSTMMVSFIYGPSYYYGDILRNCGDNEYEINVRMSSDLWSGTDDKVEIRLYGPNQSKSDWLELTRPTVDGFERLSEEFYCVKTESQPDFDFKKIGIRKLGSDDMNIVYISIERRYFTVMQWIKDDGREYIFYAD